ncbi:hypothetical protein [Deinococcus pimensis]|uniref:hypothetical protein n=1 Tax=Deinococcus pimensis TaxID=309888 RepID=UPI00047FEE69|nr:hypothetical protein [Deinococcus pimensis]
MRLPAVKFVPALAVALALSSALASTYFPREPGTTWKLSNGEVQKLAAPLTLRGVKVTPLQHVIGGKLVSEDLLDFSSGGVQLRGTRVQGRVAWYEPPLTLYPKGPLAVGQTWRSTSGGTTLTVQVVSQQALVTGGGKFNALLLRNEVTTASGGGSVNFAYFVPGLGTVRYVGANGGTVDLLK